MLITGGRLIDPARGIDAMLDVRLHGEVVTEVGEHIVARPDEEIFDATGAYVAPGFIDPHVHLREPGFPEKETIATGTLAAARGGFTAVACMPNTNPALDDPNLLAKLAAGEIGDGQPRCRLYPIAAITLGRRGESLLDYGALSRAGAVAFSDDGSTIMNARVLVDAALAARDLAAPFISHAEDEHLAAGTVMNAGPVAEALGLAGASPLCEDIIVARDLLIARQTGKSWHIAHCSTAGALELIRFARSIGTTASCEVTPHHLFFTDEAVRTLGGRAKVNPPLRSAMDARALRDAVRAGTIDCFATDHAPHTAAEKSVEIRSAAVGFSGLEIAVGAYALALPDLPLPRFVELLSTNPARLFHLPGGTLAPGSAADVTIFADEQWRVDAAHFASKGRSTPFDGMMLPRRVLATFVAGRLIQGEA